MPERDERLLAGAALMLARDEAATVSLKVRMKEPLRATLEEAARQRGVSMNAEIVRRLERSFERHDHVVDGGAIGGELYKTASELISISRQLNNALRSSLLPGFTDERSQYTELKTRLESLQGEVVSINVSLDSPSQRIIEILKALFPADLGLTIHQRDGAVTIVSRTTKDEDQ